MRISAILALMLSVSISSVSYADEPDSQMDRIRSVSPVAVHLWGLAQTHP